MVWGMGGGGVKTIILSLPTLDLGAYMTSVWSVMSSGWSKVYDEELSLRLEIKLNCHLHRSHC